MDQYTKESVENELQILIERCQKVTMSPAELPLVDRKLYNQLAETAALFFVSLMKTRRNMHIIATIQVDPLEIVDDAVMKLLRYYDRCSSLGYVAFIGNSAVLDRQRQEYRSMQQFKLAADLSQDPISDTILQAMDARSYEDWLTNLPSNSVYETETILSTASKLPGKYLWPLLAISVLGYKPSVLTEELTIRGIGAATSIILRAVCNEFKINPLIFTITTDWISIERLKDKKRVASYLSQLNLKARKKLINMLHITK